MVENRPLAGLIAHLILILGIVIVAFPIYYTFVASTPDAAGNFAAPLPLLPGDQFTENYGEALFAASARWAALASAASHQHDDRGARHRHRQDSYLHPPLSIAISSSAFRCELCSSGGSSSR